MKHSMTARARVLMLLSATAIVACTPGGEGGARTSPTGNTPPGDGLSDGGAESEAPASPAVFEVDGDPNAVDATTRRLFAIDHDTQSDEARHYLHVLPLDE
ncbi:MAG TPA: hypothetical protein VM925_08010 [Labilithrix sp.]|nr:hypothetical protein [Labilithrix sp.]